MGLLSAFAGNNRRFFAVIFAVAVLKLVYSAFAPASFDLSTIIGLFYGLPPLVGPWVGLYPPLYGVGHANSTELMNWAIQAPSTASWFVSNSLLLRGPILLLDLITATAVYFVGAALASPAEGRLAGLVWFLNPYSFLAIELLGVPDVAATLLVVCAFLMLLRKRPLWAGIALAAGTAIKLFPVLLLPPIIFWARSEGYSNRSLAAVLVLGLLGVASYLLWVLPFGLFYVTGYSPVTQPLPFFSGENWIDGSAFWLVLFYCFLGLFFSKSRSLLATLIITFFVYFIISNPAPQYLIWVLPFLAVEAALKGWSRIVLLAGWVLLGFLQWFIISSAFMTPSGYSLLFMQLRAGALVGYTSVNYLLFGNTVLGRIVLPFVTSGFYAVTLIYALEVGMAWLRSGPTKRGARAK